MKKLLLTVLLLAVHFAYPQEFQNPGFIQGTVPTALGQIAYCDYMFAARSGPDYFHPQSPDPAVGIPYNAYGYQTPTLNSQFRYIGVKCWQEGVQIPELAGARLARPTVIGHRYAILSAWSLADNSKYTCDNIGIKLGGSYAIYSYLADTGHYWSYKFDTLVATQVDSVCYLGQHFQVGNMVTPTMVNPQGQPYAYFYIGQLLITDLDATPVGVTEPTLRADHFTPVRYTDLLGREVPASTPGVLIEESTNGVLTEFRKVWR